MVAGLGHAGLADPLDAGRLPRHLLLLPRRLLQGFLGRSAHLRRRRATQGYWGERWLAPGRAERPSLFPVPRPGVPGASCPSTSTRRAGSPSRQRDAVHFGIGVGTLVLALNVVLLGGYTLGCHSLRHLVGGFLDQLTRQAGTQTRLRLRRAASTAATWSGPGAVSSGWASATCTCGCAPWASGATWRII